MMKTASVQGHAAFPSISARASFGQDLLAGLRRQPKRIPSKYLYDAKGSRLFDEICQLREYYPTRTEMSILQTHQQEIRGLLDPECLLVELGSGSSLKIRMLLDGASPAAYVPVDISKQALIESVNELQARYGSLQILPLCLDYTRGFALPEATAKHSRKLFFFPGSTIGNFEPSEGAAFLTRLRRLCRAGDGLLIGVDLKKDRRVLELAYNDAKGITAAFNLNVLARANRELHTDFDLNGFRHQAVYNEAWGRIEMHLVSMASRTVHLDGEVIPFAARESIVTEHSYKYTLAEFEGLAAGAGFRLSNLWLDENRYFSLQYFTAGG